MRESQEPPGRIVPRRFGEIARGLKSVVERDPVFPERFLVAVQALGRIPVSFDPFDNRDARMTVRKQMARHRVCAVIIVDRQRIEVA